DREAGRVAEARSVYRQVMAALDAADPYRMPFFYWPPQAVIPRRLVDPLPHPPGLRGGGLRAGGRAPGPRAEGARETPGHGRARGEAASAYGSLGNARLAAGREAEARACLARACEIQRALAKFEPNSPGTAKGLGRYLTDYGAALAGAGRLAEARAPLAEAVTI